MIPDKCAVILFDTSFFPIQYGSDEVDGSICWLYEKWNGLNENNVFRLMHRFFLACESLMIELQPLNPMPFERQGMHEHNWQTDCFLLNASNIFNVLR